jgi:hypothetical protein
MADAVSVLRQEITRLEQELMKRRNALNMLTGPGAPKKAPPKKASPTSKPASPAAAAVPTVPSLASRIVTYLTANKGKKFTTAQVAAALARIDKTVKRDNVQRRLGELFKSKKVKREDGQYGIV